MARVEATSAFAGDPQPVEVFHRGRWYAGDLLGWRHDEDGHCRARVRCVVDGLRHSAWAELSDLRLPRPAGSAPPPPRPPLPPQRRQLPVDDTQPHLLLPRAAGRPSAPRVPAPAATRTPAPVVAPAPAPVAAPTPAPVAVPAARTAPAAPDVPTTRAIPVQDAVPVG